MEPTNSALTQLLQYLIDQEIPEVARIYDLIPTVEMRAKISLNKYLGKPILTPLQSKTYSNGSKYYGELNENDKPHGRGIRILNDGYIHIGYFEKDMESTGNYITIYSDCRFEVGEFYFKDRVKWERGKCYFGAGTVRQYD